MSQRLRSNPQVEALYTSGLSGRVIAKQLGLSSTTVFTLMKRAGISRGRSAACQLSNAPHYNMNRTAFRIVTPEIGWILGVIFTDGSLNEKVQRLTICSKDKVLLEQINRILASNHPIAGPCADTTYHLCFVGTQLIADLRAFGLTPRKSRTLQWPDTLPIAMYPHFVRGLYDGDGGFYMDKRNRYSPLCSCYTSSSAPFVNRLYAMLKTHAGIIGGSCGTRKTGATRLELCHKQSVKLAHWIYNTEPVLPRLERKFLLAQPYM